MNCSREAPHPPGGLDLLEGIRVKRMERGGLRIEAPPEAAPWRATALEAMAMLMCGAPEGR